MDIRSTEAQFMVWLAHHFVALDAIETHSTRSNPPA